DALVATVLLRFAGSNALRHNADLDQLNRELRQPASAARGKRRAIVRAHIMRQPKLAKGCIEHRPDMVGVRAGQCLAAQKIAAISIGNRQRLAPLAVTGQEPALEVDAPDFVGCLAMGKGRTRWW